MPDDVTCGRCGERGRGDGIVEARKHFHVELGDCSLRASIGDADYGTNPSHDHYGCLVCGSEWLVLNEPEPVEEPA